LVRIEATGAVEAVMIASPACCGYPGSGNGGHQRSCPQHPARVFDHLDGEPEDARFSRIAHAMRRSPFWQSVPTYDAPIAVSGEVNDRTDSGVVA